MLGQNFVPTIEAYHGLITLAKTWKEAIFYLKDMAQKSVKPNIRIFNALIEKSLSVVGSICSEYASFFILVVGYDRLHI